MVPSRTSATFTRWVQLAWPRIARALPLGVEPPHEASCRQLGQLYHQAAREVACRVALACAREQLVDASDRGSAVVLLPQTDAIEVPLRRRGPFGLHVPEVSQAAHPLLAGPHRLLAHLASGLPTWSQEQIHPVAIELSDAVFNQALAMLVARIRKSMATVPGTVDPLIASEKAVTAGHPWHPMAKTRLGLHLHENLLHAPELLGHAAVTAVDLKPGYGVHFGIYDLLVNDLFGSAPKGWLRIPVLEFQRRRLPLLLPDLWGHAIRPTGVHLRGRSLLSLRTVELGKPAFHLKMAMNVLTTSARRVVSSMSAQNGPDLSRLLASIQATDPVTRETLALQPDHAAAGLRSSASPRANQLGAIVRPDPRVVARSLAGAEEQNFELWVCAALGDTLPGSHQTYLQHLAARFEGNTPCERARSFLDAYIHALVPPLLRLTCTYGVVLEAHLQNMMVAHAGARILGFVIRDLGGIRLSRPRLQQAGYDIELAPGSFLVSPNHAEFLAKLTHTLLHAHLGSVIAWAQATCDADPTHAWKTVRSEITTRLATWARQDPSIREACQRDQATLLAPTHRAKALFAMRLLGRSVDYHYTTVDNPLAHPPPRPSSSESSS